MHIAIEVTRRLKLDSCVIRGRTCASVCVCVFEGGLGLGVDVGWWGWEWMRRRFHPGLRFLFRCKHGVNKVRDAHVDSVHVS
jgi:hypothetical protein